MNWASSKNYEGELGVLKMGQISIFVPQLLFSVSNGLVLERVQIIYQRISSFILPFIANNFTLTYPKAQLHSIDRLK